MATTPPPRQSLRLNPAPSPADRQRLIADALLGMPREKSRGGVVQAAGERGVARVGRDEFDEALALQVVEQAVGGRCLDLPRTLRRPAWWVAVQVPMNVSSIRVAKPVAEPGRCALNRGCEIGRRSHLGEHDAEPDVAVEASILPSRRYQKSAVGTSGVAFFHCVPSRPGNPG